MNTVNTFDLGEIHGAEYVLGALVEWLNIRESRVLDLVPGMDMIIAGRDQAHSLVQAEGAGVIDTCRDLQGLVSVALERLSARRRDIGGPGLTDLT